MARNRIFRSILLAATALLEKKFQRAARSYRMFQHDGETWYCKKEKPNYSNIPEMQCLSETQVRQEVENLERRRNRVQRLVVAGTGQG